MEADWEVEIGGKSPIIDACWKGFLDLRRAPELVSQLLESSQFPALSGALIQLNSDPSPVWTSKCDVWIPDEVDRDELDAGSEEGKFALACYIDLLPSGDRRWLFPDVAVAECRALCARLRNVVMRCCRVDLIIRRAHNTPDRQELGFTAYLTACGPTLDSARAKLESALTALVDAILPVDPPAPTASKLQ
jgi:hypothetical protein